eukprot:10347840-Ditylum_brightwellii.AAC.2
MQEQRNHLDAKIAVLSGSLQNIANSDGPHNKRQKHSNEDANPAEVMDSADALRCNRDACDPDPGSAGGP